MIVKILISISLLCVFADGQSDQSPLFETRRPFQKGYICNYEKYLELSGPYVVAYHCQHASKCNSDRHRLPTASFDNCAELFTPTDSKFVCCHPDDDQDRPSVQEQKYLPGFKSYFMCRENAHFVCVNGENTCPESLRVLSRIWKGNATTMDTYPHIALVGYEYDEGSRYEWFCGGSIISERFVLTTGSCTKHNGQLATHVKVGEVEICSSCAPSAEEQTIEIHTQLQHPRWSATSYYHDIALLKLTKDIKFNKFVRPACIFGDASTLQTEGMFAGYGDAETSGGGHTPHAIELAVLYKDDCDTYYRGDSMLGPSGLYNELMFCAGQPATGKGPCVQDWGGSLQVLEEGVQCMWFIFGVMASRPPCGQKDKPAIFTRIAPYLSWLEGLVWENFKMNGVRPNLPECLWTTVYDPHEEGRC